MAPSPDSDEHKALSSLVDFANSILENIDLHIRMLQPSALFAGMTIPEEAPNPLSVLHTAATLLKAQITKLSLLLINKPFTPTAIDSILRECTNSIFPSILGASDLCRPEGWGHTMSDEMRRRTTNVFTEVQSIVEEVKKAATAELVDDVPAENGSSTGADNKRAVGSSKDQLTCTGTLWEACDSLMELRDLGIAGLMVKKAEQYRDTLRDAIGELKEWAEEAEDEEEDALDELHGSDADSLDDIFSAENKFPKGDTELKAQLDDSLRKLKSVDILYQALIKRRLKGLKLSPQSSTEDEKEKQRAWISKLDQLMDILSSIPELADDLASAFYELDRPEASKILEQCCDKAIQATQLLVNDWDNTEDGFTAWSAKWRANMSS